MASTAQGESGDRELKTPQKAPNEANLRATQSNDVQWIESEKADPEGRERSQFAGGRVVRDVVRDAGKHDSQRLMEGLLSGSMGISPHEGTDGAVEACPGVGPEQGLDRVVKTPQEAPNEANLKSTQSNDAQWIESEKADLEGRERSRFAAGGRVVQGAGNNRVDTMMPAAEGGEETRVA